MLESERVRMLVRMNVVASNAHLVDKARVLYHGDLQTFNVNKLLETFNPCFIVIIINYVA